MKILLTVLALLIPAFLHAQTYTDILGQAKKENKAVLLDFSGSDWCMPCKMLKRDYLDKDEFQAFAKDKIILFTVDFPKGFELPAEVAAQNRRLQQQFGVNGFPTLILITPDKDVLIRTTGAPNGGMPAFLQWLSRGLLKKE